MINLCIDNIDLLNMLLRECVDLKLSLENKIIIIIEINENNFV